LFVLAAAYLPVSAVDAGRDHVDDHLARGSGGIRQFAVLQDFWPAKVFNKNSFHRIASLPE
jgi:hypothetical protein